MTTYALTPVITHGSDSKGIGREKPKGVRLDKRIDDEVDRMMEAAKTQRCQKAHVVWPERAIVVLLGSGIGMAAAGIGMLPLIAIASLLGVCLIAYAIIRFKIHLETTSEYELLRGQLHDLEKAMWATDPNRKKAARILETIVLNRGLEFQHLGNIDHPTVENLESRMPPFCRALIRDIVHGPKMSDPVVGKSTIDSIGLRKSEKKWDPRALANRLAKENIGELKKHRKLYHQYLEGRWEEAMDAKDARLLSDLPDLEKECRRQLRGRDCLDQSDWSKAK